MDRKNTTKHKKVASLLSTPKTVESLVMNVCYPGVENNTTKCTVQLNNYCIIPTILFLYCQLLYKSIAYWILQKNVNYGLFTNRLPCSENPPTLSSLFVWSVLWKFLRNTQMKTLLWRILRSLKKGCALCTRHKICLFLTTQRGGAPYSYKLYYMRLIIASVRYIREYYTTEKCIRA